MADIGEQVIRQVVEAIVAGRMRWVPLPRERYETAVAAPGLTRRERDRLRKRGQRSRRSGRPS